MGFDVPDQSRSALVLSRLMPVVPPYVLRSPRCRSPTQPTERPRKLPPVSWKAARAKMLPEATASTEAGPGAPVSLTDLAPTA
ncbi:hypothetical protein FF1_006237 [Malus domestica]